MKTADRKKITRKMRVAYHEAGHVVVAYLLNKEFKYVTIKPESDPVMGSYYRMGHIEYSNSLDPQNHDSIENEIIFNLAGGIAEEILAGEGITGRIRALDSSLTDRHEAYKILKGLYNDIENPNAHETHFDKLYRRCVHLLGHPPHWAATEAIANKLMGQETIRYEQAKELIRTAIEGYPGNER